MKLYYYVIPFLLFSSLYGIQPKGPCDFTPVFYGTLLEFASTNNDPGVITMEPYLYGGMSYGTYDNNWKVTGDNYGVMTFQLFTYAGVTKYLQVAPVIQTQTVWYKGRSETSFVDSTFAFGWQFLWEEKNTPKPNLRLDTIAVFPTGKYQRLGTTFNGHNATGLGSYGLILAFIVDKTFYGDPCHPLNMNIATGYSHLWRTNLHEVNIYGGAPDTHGVMYPGDRAFVYLGLEYYLKHDLNFALDVQYTHSFPNTFRGFPGTYPDGSPADILTAPTDLLAVAPAVEIGFTPNMALYIGGYFTVAGRNNNASAEGNLTFVFSF